MISYCYQCPMDSSGKRPQWKSKIKDKCNIYIYIGILSRTYRDLLFSYENSNHLGVNSNQIISVICRNLTALFQCHKKCATCKVRILQYIQMSDTTLHSYRFYDNIKCIFLFQSRTSLCMLIPQRTKCTNVCSYLVIMFTIISEYLASQNIVSQFGMFSSVYCQDTLCLAFVLQLSVCALRSGMQSLYDFCYSLCVCCWVSPLPCGRCIQQCLTRQPM